MGIGDMGEKASDAAIEKGGDLADDRTGGGQSDKIDKGEDMLDGKIGGDDSK